jgi:hydrogenase nickel incorporation protein HypA/HybF
MHELALAEAVITTAIDAAEKNDITRITRISVRIGQLQSIKSDIFEFALRELVPRSETRIASAEIAVEQEPARFRCRPCGHEFALTPSTGPSDEEESEAIHFIPELAHSFLHCPECNSPDFEVLQGRGVTIEAIEGE